MSAPLLELRDLVVEYALPGHGGRARAVDRVSLRIERGEALGLVGESGSGKSTLARAVVGLVRPTSGNVLLDGIDLAGLRGARAKAVRQRLSMLHQDPFASLDPRRTALQSVVEPLAIHRRFKPRERRLRFGAHSLPTRPTDPSQAHTVVDKSPGRPSPPRATQ